MIFSDGLRMFRQDEVRGLRPEVPQQRRTQHDAGHHFADHARLAEVNEQFSQPAAQQQNQHQRQAARGTAHRAWCGAAAADALRPLPLRPATGASAVGQDQPQQPDRDQQHQRIAEHDPPGGGRVRLGCAGWKRWWTSGVDTCGLRRRLSRHRGNRVKIEQDAGRGIRGRQAQRPPSCSAHPAVRNPRPTPTRSSSRWSPRARSRACSPPRRPAAWAPACRP